MWHLSVIGIRMQTKNSILNRKYKKEDLPVIKTDFVAFNYQFRGKEIRMAATVNEVNLINKLINKLLINKWLINNKYMANK